MSDTRHTRQASGAGVAGTPLLVVLSLSGFLLRNSCHHRALGACVYSQTSVRFLAFVCVLYVCLCACVLVCLCVCVCVCLGQTSGREHVIDFWGIFGES